MRYTARKETQVIYNTDDPNYIHEAHILRPGESFEIVEKDFEIKDIVHEFKMCDLCDPTNVESRMIDPDVVTLYKCNCGRKHQLLHKILHDNISEEDLKELEEKYA